jgi:HlyD family secretion protein
MAQNNNNNTTNGGSRRRSFRVAAALAVVVVIGMAVVWLKVVRGGEEPASEFATFVAKRGPLTISVLESGTIKSRDQDIIKNEVEGRTSIIWIIDEGAHVEKGDLLVKLDSSTLEDTKIDQEIRVQNAKAAFINASESFEVIKNQAQADVDLAELTLKFAQQDRDQYLEGQYPNEETAAINEVKLAEEQLTRAKETLTWSQKLYEEKYISHTELQADQLAVISAENRLTVAQNDLNLLQNFTKQRNIDQLESDVSQAEMALERAQRKYKADVAQAEADLTAKDLEYKRQQDKLAKLEDQLAKTEVKATKAGMVIYATTARRGGWRDNREPLDEGVEVFERQELIYLPTTASAMAEVDIHEASLEKVRVGLPTIVTVDALPGKRFFGTVSKIAPLPDSQSMWMNPDLKVYNSEVDLEGDEPDLRTGMSCKVDIIVAQYEDAVYIPVQAVVRIAGQPTAYVVNDGVIEERPVEIGLDNNRMVRIISGIEEGETVLLTPPLKAATIEDGDQMLEDESAGGAGGDALKQRINQKLEEANGTQGSKAGVPAGDAAGAEQGQQQGLPSMEQMRQMQQRLANMSPEERQQEMEKLRKQFENMSEEDREKLRQRFQGGGQGQGPGGGPRQGGGRRQGGEAGQGATQRPRGAERNP